jgi:hypothetical protein
LAAGPASAKALDLSGFLDLFKHKPSAPVNVPELDPEPAGSAIALLIAAGLTLQGRRRNASV